MFCPNPDCPGRTEGPAEYRDGVTHCEDCGSTLVAALPEFRKLEPLKNEDLVPVFQITNAAVVPFVESLLTSADIPYFIKGDRIHDFFRGGRVAVVYVESGRAEEARELLAEVENAPEDDGSISADDASDDDDKSPA